MYSERRFLILRRPIQESDLHNLLGKITLDYTSPLDDSVPADPTPYTKDCLLEVVTETAAETWGAATEGSLIRAALKPFADVTYGQNSEMIYSMTTSWIRTHGLKNHNTVFARIWEKHEEEIHKLLDNATLRLSAVPDNIYMVTGYKAVWNATRTETASNSMQAAFSEKVPVGAVTAVPTGGAVPAGAALEISFQKTNSLGDGIHSTLEGETAVAVEYHTYRRSRILALMRKNSYGTLVDWGVKLFGGGRAMWSKSDCLEEEEDSDNEFLLELEGSGDDRFTLEEGPSDSFWVPRDTALADKSKRMGD